MAIGSGILTYYGDDVLAFDTVERKWSRVGKIPYGCITSHCGSNGTHVLCATGEPRHGWYGNGESVVQIGRIEKLRHRGEENLEKVFTRTRVPVSAGPLARRPLV